MYKYPFVSIIIPALNEEQYIDKVLKSVANLNYPKERMEVIVVDNGSTDSTIAITESNKAKVVRCRKQSISAARNLGVKHSVGDIIAFLDADCLVPEDWLTGILKHFSRDDVGGVGPAIAPPCGNLTWVEKVFFYIARYKYKKTKCVATLSSFNINIRRNIFDQIGGFNENLTTGEDSDLGYRVNQVGKLVYESQTAVVHLRNPRTAKELFLKELWRGQGNIKSFLSHRLDKSEIPGVIVPIFYLTLILILPFVFIISFFDLALEVLIGTSFLLLALPFLMTIRTCLSSRKLILVPQIYAYHTICLLAKAVSLILHTKRRSHSTIRCRCLPN